jgi:hypothetical protein
MFCNAPEASKESQDIIFRLYSPSESVSLCQLNIHADQDPRSSEQERIKLKYYKGKEKEEMEIQKETASDTKTHRTSSVN